MIPVANRFRGSRLIDHVYRRGQTVRIDFITAKATPSKEPGHKLAVVVSKKVNKSAVVRNRIRRRIYEQFRTILKDSDKAPNMNIVVSDFDEKAATVEATYLKKTCEKLLQKLTERIN